MENKTPGITPIQRSFDQFMADQQNWRKKHPITGFIKYNIYYPFCRLIGKLENIPREIKWFIQRGQRGYSDCDVWNLNSYLSDIIAKALKKLKNNLHGHPSQLSFEQWQEAIDDMIFTFELENKIVDEWPIVEWDYDSKEKFETMKAVLPDHAVIDNSNKERYERGWKHFKEFFTTLWD